MVQIFNFDCAACLVWRLSRIKLCDPIVLVAYKNSKFRIAFFQGKTISGGGGHYCIAIQAPGSWLLKKVQNPKVKLRVVGATPAFYRSVAKPV